MTVVVVRLDTDKNENSKLVKFVTKDPYYFRRTGAFVLYVS
jgi:hypothetical protein